MYINGQWLSRDTAFQSTSPTTGEVLGQVAQCNDEDINNAIEAAHHAFKDWSNRSAYQRAECLSRAHALMLERQHSLAKLMTQEQGKPLKAALNEVRYGADFLQWYAEEAKRQYGETIPSARTNQRFLVHRQAVGVVGAITPWNYPISMLTRKLAPALAAGCTVVLKPAESTPLCAVAVFEILHEAGFPAGTVNLITRQNPTAIGEAFCTHPLIKKLTFTGSTAVGKQLATAAAPHLKRVSMELGGHAPFVVFDDADPVHAAKGAALVKFLNAGQACISPNRLLVQRPLLEPFLATLTQRIDALKVGNGLEDGVSVGPLINEAAVNKVHQQVTDALAKGATLHCGGHALREGAFKHGHFYAPTLLSGVTAEMRIYREETFGPVAAVSAFDNDAQAIEQANDTHYGLAAYLYTPNLSRALRSFEALNFGIIGINDINPTSAAAPFGGMGDSGLGREGAKEGLHEYLETKLGGLTI